MRVSKPTVLANDTLRTNRVQTTQFRPRDNRAQRYGGEIFGREENREPLGMGSSGIGREARLGGHGSSGRKFEFQPLGEATIRRPRNILLCSVWQTRR